MASWLTLGRGRDFIFSVQRLKHGLCFCFLTAVKELTHCRACHKPWSLDSLIYRLSALQTELCVWTERPPLFCCMKPWNYNLFSRSGPQFPSPNRENLGGETDCKLVQVLLQHLCKRHIKNNITACFISNFCWQPEYENNI